MTVSLSKGGNVSLSKEAPGMRTMRIGLGWDMRVTDGSAFDLDASVFVLGEDGKVRKNGDFVFFNNLTGGDGAVVHQGDNLTGEGEGDDEVILVTLDKLPANVARISFAATIYEADQRRQNFGMVQNAFIRVVNGDGGKEVARYDLSEDASTETAMIFGELYRHGGEWKFKAIGQGFGGGLGPLARSFGVSV
ncbi:MAG TPA: TerD family protein [Allosphingosinicella sp.]|nr:TerD family protein [Allosphingosinicella sp.]